MLSSVKFANKGAKWLRTIIQLRLGEVLDQSLKRLDLAPQLEAYGIWNIWHYVAGKPVALNAQPEKIHGFFVVRQSIEPRVDAATAVHEGSISGKNQ